MRHRNMEKWSYGDMERWTRRHGHGDMDIEMEKWAWRRGHGDEDMETCNQTENRSQGNFP
jgi:hypothetical protein